MRPELIYAYITRRRPSSSVAAMCRVLKVSESGYYRSLHAQRGLRPWQLLLVRIREIYDEHPDNRCYGVNRILLALTQRNVQASRSSVRMPASGMPVFFFFVFLKGTEKD